MLHTFKDKSRQKLKEQVICQLKEKRIDLKSNEVAGFFGTIFEFTRVVGGIKEQVGKFNDKDVFYVPTLDKKEYKKELLDGLREDYWRNPNAADLIIDFVDPYLDVALKDHHIRRSSCMNNTRSNKER